MTLAKLRPFTHTPLYLPIALVFESGTSRRPEMTYFYLSSRKSFIGQLDRPNWKWTKSYRRGSFGKKRNIANSWTTSSSLSYQQVTEIILFLPVLSILFFLIEWKIQFQIERIQFPRKGGAGRLLLAWLPADFLGLLSFLKAYSNRKDWGQVNWLIGRKELICSGCGYELR